MILRERLSAKAIAYLRTSPFVIRSIEHKGNECASSYILCTAPQEAQGKPRKMPPTPTFACVRIRTILKAETALACAVAPAHGPSTLGVWGASIGLS